MKKNSQQTTEETIERVFASLASAGVDAADALDAKNSVINDVKSGATGLYQMERSNYSLYLEVENHVFLTVSFRSTTSDEEAMEAVAEANKTISALI